MNTFYQIDQRIVDKLEDLKENIRRYQNGDLSNRAFKAMRVPCGIYEQRSEAVYMIRVRIAGGGITRGQARTLADISRRFGSGDLHITTRQDIQIHGVKGEENLCEIIDSLLEVNLTSFAGGGNSIRNITSCPFSAVCPNELLDAAGCGVKLTELLVPRADSSGLPRKYKISFSGCASDCAHAAFTDLGFIARKENNAAGYRVFAGGGLGARPAAGIEIFDFVESEEAPYAAEAVKRVFREHGNREDKHSARLRFARQKLGDDKFIQLCREELAAVKKEEDFDFELPVFPGRRPEKAEPGHQSTPWFKANTRIEKDGPYHSVVIPVPLGDISAGDLVASADLGAEFADGNLYTSQYQGLILKSVPANKLETVAEKLAEINPDFSVPLNYIFTRTCKGAATCKLGLCLSQNLEKELQKKLKETLPDSPQKQLKLFISGCPNACGQHFLADIGFYGSVKRKNGRAVPCYRVVAGGTIDNQLGSSFGQLPAYRVPDLVAELLEDFNASKTSTFKQFFESGGSKRLESLIEKYEDIPEFTVDRNYYYDWGAEEPFEISKLGEAECGAGVLSLIESDLKETRTLLKRHDKSENNLLYQALQATSRALLVTRGEDASDPKKILELFRTHFLDSGLIDSDYSELIDAALESQSLSQEHKSAVQNLFETVSELYGIMDSSFKFPGESESENQPDASQKIEQSRDLRGVGCPINYVKAKLFLEEMKSGETLELLIDAGEPIENVPVSLKEDGHKILVQEKTEDHYRLLVEKA